MAYNECVRRGLDCSGARGRCHRGQTGRTRGPVEGRSEMGIDPPSRRICMRFTLRQLFGAMGVFCLLCAGVAQAGVDGASAVLTVLFVGFGIAAPGATGCLSASGRAVWLRGYEASLSRKGKSRAGAALRRAGHCGESTFSCYRRTRLSNNDVWRSMLSESVGRAAARRVLGRCRLGKCAILGWSACTG